MEAQRVRFVPRRRSNMRSSAEGRDTPKRNVGLGMRSDEGGPIARTEFDVLDDTPAGTTEQLVLAMEAASSVHVSDTFVEHVVDVVNRTRSHPDVELGASPRAGIALLKSAKARALIRGRRYVVPDDLYALAPDVILHRVRLNYEALADGKHG